MYLYKTMFIGIGCQPIEGQKGQKNNIILKRSNLLNKTGCWVTLKLGVQSFTCQYKICCSLTHYFK